MIEINEISAQAIYIPSNGNGAGTEYVLVVRNTIDNTSVTLPVTNVVVSGRYYRMTLASADVPHAGEWEYVFSVDDTEVSKGLLKVNTGDVEVVAFNAGNEKECIEYGG